MQLAPTYTRNSGTATYIMEKKVMVKKRLVMAVAWKMTWELKLGHNTNS